MSVITKLKKVKVKRSDFSKIFNAAALIKYLTYCVQNGSGYVLFEDPNITTEFYDLGIAAYESIELSLKDYNGRKSKAKLKALRNTMVVGKKWAYAYSDQVEDISNDDANCNTQEEAAANISQSYLTPQKLAQGRKGNPEQPVITGAKKSGGIIDFFHN
jgi:hypothetical protein